MLLTSVIVFVLLLVVVYFIYRAGAADKLTDRSEAWKPEAIRLRKVVGGFVNVVGESHYADNLKGILRATPEIDGHRWVIATLTPEPSNPHDPNAVKILIDDSHVGYLSKADAKKFRKSHSAAIESEKPIQCRARLDGGTRERPNIGVRLDFNPVEEVRYKG